MKTITLPATTIPLIDSYDVIVAGGGPAGCAAAAAAARAGAKTLLVESSSALGGMGTGGLVPAWCPYTDKEKIIYGGMAEWVLRRSMEETPHLRQRIKNGQFDWVPIDPELLKRIYDDLVIENGADLFFNGLISAVDHRDGKIRGVIIASKAGLEYYRAKTFVDCTGDADLAAWSGARFDKGDQEGELQPATLCFRLANVDSYAYEHIGTIQHGPFPRDEQKIYAIVRDGKYPRIPDAHACNCVQGPGVIGFNAGHLWKVDNTQPASVGKAMVEGRRLAKDFRDAFAEYFPEAFANSYLVQTAPMMGIRETRRIIGDYRLTVEDFMSCRHFEDEIGCNAYAIDVHHQPSQIGTSKEGMGPDLPPGRSHGIPYRCLLPAGLQNLLVAGRCISAEREVQGSTRIMPSCLVMGEAAGTAAAMASKRTGNVRDIDIQHLRDDLRLHGAYLP